MSLINNLSHLFISRKNYINPELRKVFAILEEFTGEDSVRGDFLYRLDSIESKKILKNEDLIKLYFDWENYVVNRHSLVQDKNITNESLRRIIKEKITKDLIDKEISVIFSNEKERFVYLAEKFLNDIVKYVSDTLGAQTLNDIYSVLIKDTDISSIAIKKDGFGFDAFNQKFVYDTANNVPFQRIVSIFKVLFEVLSEKVEVSFGDTITKKLFSDVFSKLQRLYTAEFVSEVIKIIPERVLSFDEWLSKLSKGELESRVKEKTEELENLNNELEKKVNERTEELRQAFEELKLLDKKKSEFIYLVAHQMRTPLVSIKWALSMLKDGDLGTLNDGQHKVLIDAYNANERMNKTINEILLADDIMNGTLRHEEDVFDISEMIKKVVDELKEVAGVTEVTVEYQNIKDNIFVTADRDKIKMAMLSLIDNAIRYSPPKEKVIISFTSSPDHMVGIHIKDKGIGIPKESFDRVGERFYRADNALKQNTYGTGLGIFIVKNVIEGSKGKFIMESEEGRGTIASIIPRESIKK